MNKPALAAAGVAILALAGVPWVFGGFAQQRVAGDIERLDAESDIEAEVVDYARGWSSSTATIELRAPQGTIDPARLPPGLAPELAGAVTAWLSEPVRLLVTMRHGPILLGDGAQIGLVASTIHLDPATPGYQALLDELGIPYLFELRSMTGFDGRTDFVNEMPAFALERNELTLTFSGSDSAGSYDATTRHLEAAGVAAQVHVEANGGTFDLEELRFNSDSTRYNDLLRLGFAEASIARISADVPGESFALDDFNVRFDLDLEDGGEYATMTSAYSLARLTGGEGMNLSDLALTATARRVDIDALSAYYAGMQDFGMQNDAAAPLSLTAEDALYELMASSPQLEFAPLTFNWNGEPLNATLRVVVDGASLPPRSNFTVVLVLALQGVMSVDASLELSAALANTIAARGMAFQLSRGAAEDGIFMTEDEIEVIAQTQAAAALAGLVAQGMLTSTNGGYATTAQFAQGELTVNGNALPLGFR